MKLKDYEFYRSEKGVLYCGDSNDILPLLESKSIDMGITSPPYWLARKYVSDDELGQESNFHHYLKNLCSIFLKLRPAFKETGNLFVNIGDKYFSTNVGTGGPSKKQDSNSGSRFEQKKKINPLLNQGTLVGIPHRFAILMNDIYGYNFKHTLIWQKPNSFVTSNKKKFTLDYEFLFHFVIDLKKYYFKQQFEPFVEGTDVRYRRELRKNKEYNVKEPYKNNTPYKHNSARITSRESPNRVWRDSESLERQMERGRNKRSVWTIPTKPFKGSHTAAYPPDLIITPIEACCPIDGVLIDPFIGSGTTALVAEKLKRRWIGIEISEEYCKLIEERLESKNV